MTAEKFYQKCVPDAQYFFNVYFAFVMTMCAIGGNNSLFEVTDVKNNRQLVGQEKDLFFFFMTLFVLPTTVGNTMKTYSANIFQDYKFDDAILNILISIADKSRQFTLEQQENYFQTNLKGNSIMQIGLYDGIITIENVLLRLIDQILWYYEDLVKNFKINEIRGQIETLAKEKASGDRIVINANSKIDDDLKKISLTDKKESNPNGILTDRELTKRKITTDPLIGREKEFRILGARILDTKKSVIMYGKPGVGKTTLVESLAYRIQNNKINPLLLDKRIFEMSATEMVEGTSLRGQLEGKMLQIIRELMNIPNAILFIDEIHMIMGGGKTLGDKIDISNILKPYVGNGKLKIIGATTKEEYKAIKRDGALMRRFNGIYIPELDHKTVLAILNHEIDLYEKNYGITFPFSGEERNQLLELLIGLSDSAFQGEDILYNPDFALTMLNNSYDLARYDGDDTLFIDTLVEGIEIADQVNQAGKAYFKDEVLKLARNK